MIPVTEPKTRDEYLQWKSEADDVEKLLNECEANEHQILRGLGVSDPTDRVKLYEMFKGDQPAPWASKRKQTARREEDLARRSWFALLWIDKARSYTRLGAENARLAAHAALIAGSLVSDSTVRAIRKQQTFTAAKERGKLASDDREDIGATVRQVAVENPPTGRHKHDTDALHASLAQRLADVHDIRGARACHSQPGLSSVP